MKVAKITDVVKKLNDIRVREGDLPVYSVGFHSDFRAVPIDIDNMDEYFVTQDDAYPFDEKKDEIHLMIYGGCR